MARRRLELPAEEPLGIVISRGAEPEQAPTVLAFVWAPEDVELPELVAA
jgi:hypothetical protein